MRQAELPEGESLADETTYANFKERMESSSGSTYYETNQYVQNFGFFDSYNPIFCGMYPYNYYPSSTLFFGQGIPGFHQDLSWYGSYGYPYYSSYYNYNPFFSIYDYNPYFGSGYFNQGYGFFNDGVMYTYNYNNYYIVNNQTAGTPGNSGYSNYHEGPRGSLSGFSNAANRLGFSTIKSSENASNFWTSKRPNVVGNYILSEDDNNTITNVIGARTSTHNYNYNLNKSEYIPKEQRIQQFNKSLDYNYSSFGTNTNVNRNNSGNNVTRNINRDVQIQSTPSRTNSAQPSRSNGVSRPITPGRRN
jgi:hypothetical protein